MDPIDRRQRIPPEADIPERMDDDVSLEEGTFRGSEGNRDVHVEDKRKRTRTVGESSSHKEPPRQLRRIIDERDVSFSPGREKLSKSEKQCLSAGGKKGTADGKKGKALDEASLKKFYLRTKLGKEHPELFNIYLRGYHGSNAPALGHQKAPLVEAERLGKTYGCHAARRGLVFKSEAELESGYKASHVDATGEEVAVYVRAYKEGYVKVKGTLLDQAERFGKTNGAQAARQGVALKSEAALESWYRRSYMDATDEEVVAYVRAYKVGYVKAKGTPLDQAERLGKTNGSNAARQGVVLKSEAALESWYRRSYTDATDEEAAAYVRAYKESYDEAKESPLEQVKRLGTRSGSKAAREGHVLKSEAELGSWYKASHVDATGEEAAAYAKAYIEGYDEAKGTALEQTERLGTRNGYQAAKEGHVLKSGAALESWYKESHVDATGEEAAAYVRAYKAGYVKAKGTALEQAERLGRMNGSHAARRGIVLKSEVALESWYKESHTDATGEEAAAYAVAYKEGYDEAKGTPLDQAERLGKTNGFKAARDGHVFKSEAELESWYKESHVDATGEEVAAYMRSYQESYVKAKGTPLEQAERLGTRNGSHAARQGLVIKSEAELGSWYKESHTDATDEEAAAYVRAYKEGYVKAKGTPLDQAERLGKTNGSHAARLGVVLKSEAELEFGYKESHTDATDEEAVAYAKAYKASYEKGDSML